MTGPANWMFPFMALKKPPMFEGPLPVWEISSFEMMDVPAVELKSPLLLMTIGPAVVVQFAWRTI